MTRFTVLIYLLGMVFATTGCSNPDPEIIGECDHFSECDDGQQCIDSMCQSPDAPSSNDEDGKSNTGAPDSGIADTNMPPPDTDTVPDDDTGGEDSSYEGVDCRVEPCEEGLLCDENTGHCEECIIDEQCQEHAVCNHQTNRCSCVIGYQYCDGECISLDSVDSCGSECVPCPEVNNGAAVCIERQCGAECDDGFYYCDEDCTAEPGHCVECIEDEHCTSLDAPVCDGGSCAPCTESAHCADTDEAFPVCIVESGDCVECTMEEFEACGAKSCHPQEFECTNTLRYSVTTCRPCLSDVECAADHHCVPMEFDGQPRESAYCLKLASADCEFPFETLSIKESVSGAEMEIYCGVNEDVTTCEAVHDYGFGCSSDDDCGDPDLDDGVCSNIEFEPMLRCSYYCEPPVDETAPNECPEFFGCGQSTGGYCGGD